MSRHEPIFNVPTVVVASIAILIGIHVVRALLPAAAGDWLLLVMAFIPARLAGFAPQLPGGDFATWSSFLTHMLVHGDITHLLFNSAWLLAFGGAIALRVSAVKTILFGLACGIAGVVTFLAFNAGLFAPVVGASGAISGLMGGTMRFLFCAVDRGGLQMLRFAPQHVPALSLRETLRDQRILMMTGIWIAINMLAIFGIGAPSAAGGIAWEAHVGGFVFGLLAFGVFDVRKCERKDHQPFLH